MFDMIPYKRNSLSRRNDFFTPFLKSFFDDDFFSETNGANGNFKVDLKETEDNYLVEADLPGIKKEDINVDFDNNYLVISAKRDDIIEDKNENYVRRERHYGQFQRSFYIDNADRDKIEAAFQNGVLKITLPKLNKENERKTKIDIQ